MSNGTRTPRGGRGGGGGAAETLQQAYAAGAAGPQVITLDVTRKGVELDHRALTAGSAVLATGDPTATDPMYATLPWPVIGSFKNPNAGLDSIATCINEDYVRITGQIHGRYNGLNSGNGIPSEQLVFASDRDFTLQLGKSFQIEGGDFYIRAGDGCDVSSPGNVGRHFGGSIWLYSGRSGVGSGDVCGIIILDTVAKITPGLASGIFNDISLGQQYAQTVGIGRLSQGDGGFLGSTGTSIAGSTISLLVPLNGVIAGTQDGVERFNFGSDITLTSDPGAHGIVLRPGNFGCTVDGAFAVEDTSSGGAIRVQIDTQVKLTATNYIELHAGDGVRCFTPIELFNCTTAARNALGVVTTGSSIFNTDTNKPNFYVFGTGWLHADGSAA